MVRGVPTLPRPPPPTAAPAGRLRFSGEFPRKGSSGGGPGGATHCFPQGRRAVGPPLRGERGRRAEGASCPGEWPRSPRAAPPSLPLPPLSPEVVVRVTGLLAMLETDALDARGSPAAGAGTASNAVEVAEGSPHPVRAADRRCDARPRRGRLRKRKRQKATNFFPIEKHWETDFRAENGQ